MSKQKDLKKVENVITEIKNKEKELDLLKKELDKLGMVGQKIVYFNGEMIGWCYDLKIDRLNIRIDGEKK